MNNTPKAPRTPALGDSYGWHLVPYQYDIHGDVRPYTQADLEKSVSVPTRAEHDRAGELR